MVDRISIIDNASAGTPPTGKIKGVGISDPVEI